MTITRTHVLCNFGILIIITITITITITTTTGGIWKASGRHLEPSGRHLGGIWKHLEASGGIWGHLGASGRHLGVIWESSGTHLGVIGEASERPGLPRQPQGDLRGRSLKKCYHSQLKCNFSRKTQMLHRFFEGTIAFVLIFTMNLWSLRPRRQWGTSTGSLTKTARIPTAGSCLGKNHMKQILDRSYFSRTPIF